MFNINNNCCIEPINASHDVSKLSLGSASFTPLKIFLKRNALDFHQYEIAKTFVVVDAKSSSHRVWGYITLVMSEVNLNESQRPSEPISAMNYKSYPAAKIAGLAVDKSLHGNGIGKSLLEWAVNLLRLGVMSHIGCRYMIVDAKQESIPFYQKNGFVFFETEKNLHDEYPLMFFDLYRKNTVTNQRLLGNEMTEPTIV